MRIVGVETAGCPTLTKALEAGGPVVLEDVQTNVPILGARKTEDLNYELVRDNVDEIILVDEESPAKMARWMWAQTGLAVELGAATVVSAVLNGFTNLRKDERAVAVLCGSGDDGMDTK